MGPARRGFTLIELLVVLALIAIASGVASVALRDPSATRLEQEAARLTALFEAARAEARASGVQVRWQPVAATPEGAAGFRFSGLPPAPPPASHWLTDGTTAEVVGARAVVLGPEPMIPAQRVVLRLGDRRLVVATDGLGPFSVVNE